MAVWLGACSLDEELGVEEEELLGPTPLVGVASGKCLDVKDNSSAPGQTLQIWPCHGGANQGFTFTDAGELRTFGTTRCLATQNGGTGNGTLVTIATCNNTANQKWTLGSNGTISHNQSGRCVDVKGASTANGAAVQIYTCHGNGNQRWKTSVDTQAPSPPGNVAVSNVTCNSATLSWSASTDNVGVAFYDVYHDGQQMLSVGGSTLSTTITTVPGVEWGLYVNARDAAGNVSQASATLLHKPPQCQIDSVPPSAPGNLTGSASGTSVSLAWNPSTDNVGVTAYDVLRGGAKIGTTTGASSTSFVDSGLAANTTYGYQVVARDAQGNVSPASNTLTVTTGGACGSPICGVQQVGSDNDVPWGLVNLPDGTILYAQRDAQNIIRLDPATGQKASTGKVPNVQSTDGEGGLMGLAIGPGFASDRWLYVMHTSPSDNRIVRLKYTTANKIDTSTLQVLVAGIKRNKYHNGGRLRFGPDGKLYASTGDAQNGANAQNKNDLAGKVLRLNPDGSIPSDNPFGNHVWSYGHRNPQGLAFDSQGRLWEQEFGNSIMDETNLIVKGGNYGWPDCEGTSGNCGQPGFIAPKTTYTTASGSCSGITIINDRLFVACTRGARLYRLVISGDALINKQEFFNGTYGRLRTVEPAPGGNMWLTTTTKGDKDSTPNNSDEKIFRVLLGN